MTNLQELWLPVKGFEIDYEISSFGRLKRTTSARGTFIGWLFHPAPDKKGYLRTRLTIDGKGFTVKMHRLVALTFIPNPNNFPQVNHKDGIKSNNNVSNLEWCDNNYNVKHKVENNLTAHTHLGKFGKDHNRSVQIEGIKNGKSCIFYGVPDACRKHGLNPRSVQYVLDGVYSHTKGWKFIRLTPKAIYSR